MKTLTTVVLFQLNLYTAYTFHTGVKGEREKEKQPAEIGLRVYQTAFTSVFFPGLPLQIRM